MEVWSADMPEGMFFLFRTQCRKNYFGGSHMKKRITALLLTALMLTGMLAGCG